MTQIIIGKTKVNLNVRSSPGGEKLGFHLPAGTSIEGDEKRNQWIHLTKVDGEAVLTSAQWVSDGGGSYVDWQWTDAPETPTEPPPVEEPDPDPNVVSIIKTYSDGSVTVNGESFPI